MARNAIESEFRTSKLADVSHFVKVRIDLKWPEIRTSKMGAGSHFVKKFKKRFVLI